MSSMSEKFCLKWNDFQQNIMFSFKALREIGDFSDVTLVCEEDQEIEAHRVILSACSPMFQNILKKNKHIHPLIYMRGVKAKHLLSIVDFMYHGEAEICQDELDDFLALAEELQLKGLSGGNSGEELPQTVDDVEKLNSTKPDTQNITMQSKMRVIKDESYTSDTINKDESFTPYNMDKNESSIALGVSDNSSYEEGTVSIQKDFITTVSLDNAQELDEQINSMMLKVDGKWSCTVCGKVASQKSNMTQHIEANHIEGMTHTCNQCGKPSRSRHALHVHVYSNHRSKKVISGQDMV